jgi:tRNA(Ile)-lysidine synthetase-like protein
MINYNEIVDFWFQNRLMWFGASEEQDAFIKVKYETALMSAEADTTEIDHDDPFCILGKIIIFDQIAKHIHRNDTDQKIHFTQMACDIVMNYLDKINMSQFTPDQLFFFLMPLRHSKNVDNIKLVLYILANKMKLIDQTLNSKIYSQYSRFYFHTLKDYSRIVNTIQFGIVHESNKIPDFVLYHTIVDKSQKKWFESMSYDIDFIKIVSLHSFKQIKAFCKKNKVRETCVSLSGGIDSMLVLCCCIYLRNIDVLTRLEAVHINYCNRKLAWFEREFVIRFCARHNVTLHIRDINEIHRTKEQRKIYEDLTCKIRFDFYKLTNLPVMLGHNADDCIENIVTNLKKQINYHNLVGMDFVSTKRNVIIWRPLLHVSKAQIKCDAKIINLCHTKNSTPITSERGKIRQIVIPFLDKHEMNFIDDLHIVVDLLSKQFKEIDVVAQQIVDKTVIDSHSIFVPHDAIYDRDKLCNLHIWKYVFHKLAARNKFKPFSSKSIKYFVDKLKQMVSCADDDTASWKFTKNTKIMLNKSCVATIATRGDIELRFVVAQTI